MPCCGIPVPGTHPTGLPHPGDSRWPARTRPPSRSPGLPVHGPVLPEAPGARPRSPRVSSPSPRVSQRIPCTPGAPGAPPAPRGSLRARFASPGAPAPQDSRSPPRPPPGAPGAHPRSCPTATARERGRHRGRAHLAARSAACSSAPPPAPGPPAAGGGGAAPARSRSPPPRSRYLPPGLSPTVLPAPGPPGSQRPARSPCAREAPEGRGRSPPARCCTGDRPQGIPGAWPKLGGHRGVAKAGGKQGGLPCALTAWKFLPTLLSSVSERGGKGASPGCTGRALTAGTGGDLL